MKKLIMISAIALTLASCSNTSSNNETSSTTPNSDSSNTQSANSTATDTILNSNNLPIKGAAIAPPSSSAGEKK